MGSADLVAISLVCSLMLYANIALSAPDWDSDQYLKYLSAKVTEIREDCLNSTGVTADDIEGLEEGKIPETETAKCYVACEYKGYGIINSKGKYDKDGIFEILPKFVQHDKTFNGFRKLMARCEQAVAKVDEGDDCELARKLKLCFKEHASEFGVKGFMGLDFTYSEEDYYDYSSESESSEYEN